MLARGSCPFSRLSGNALLITNRMAACATAPFKRHGDEVVLRLCIGAALVYQSSVISKPCVTSRRVVVC